MDNQSSQPESQTPTAPSNNSAPQTDEPTNDATLAILGGCLCGATRYRLLAEPRALVDCHCIDCRRSSGAPFVTWGTVRRSEFTVTDGNLRKIPFAQRIRGFAACCGTHLTFEDAEDSETLDVTIASFDNPSPFVPTKAVWTEDKLPWVVLDPLLPAFPRRSSGGA